MKRTALVVLAAVLCSSSPATADVEPMTPELFERIKIMAESARAKAPTAPKLATQYFWQQFNPEFGNVEPRVTGIHNTRDLTITLATPLNSLFSQLTRALSRLEPLEAITQGPDVAIMVLPRTVNSPDVERIVLVRDGKFVEPVAVKLGPMELKTLMGGSVSRHVGSVEFPVTAFDPAQAITIIAIPASGANIERTLSPEDLRQLR